MASSSGKGGDKGQRGSQVTLSTENKDSKKILGRECFSISAERASLCLLDASATWRAALVQHLRLLAASPIGRQGACSVRLGVQGKQAAATRKHRWANLEQAAFRESARPQAAPAKFHWPNRPALASRQSADDNEDDAQALRAKSRRPVLGPHAWAAAAD